MKKSFLIIATICIGKQTKAKNPVASSSSPFCYIPDRVIFLFYERLLFCIFSA